MSFNFQWPTFSETFQSDAASMLTSALNRGPKPKVIADDINVEDINMGTIPPDLEMLEIGELSTDRFRGIFRLTYAGDAHLILSTKVQANPLTRPTPASSPYGFEDASSVFPSSMPSRGILFAARPLVVPMQLRLSAVRLKAIVVLVVSKQKGITLVFKNDPLESVDVSSTFDSVAVIQKYLQQEIEGQLREMFREDLPGIIHRLSQRWLSGNRDVPKPSQSTSAKANRSRSSTSAQPTPSASSSAAAAAPSSTSTVPTLPISSRSAGVELSTPDKKTSKQRSQKASSEIFTTPKRSPSRRRKADKFPLSSTPPSPRLTHRSSTTISTSPRTSNGNAKNTAGIRGSDIAGARREEADLSSSFGLSRTWNSSLIEDMESYDPTYGLRPDEVRMAIHGTGYSGLARLANQVNGGLRDLTLEKEKEMQKGKEESERVEPQAGAVPEQALLSDDDESDYGDGQPIHEKRQEEGSDVFVDDDDDVPDYPEKSDNSEAEEGGEEGEDESRDENKGVDDFDTAADFTMYGYPPPGAAFSDTAMEDSARRSASVFGFSASVEGSPRVKQGLARTQTYGGASRPSSVVATSVRRRSKSGKASKVEYETIPAVGGGIITRPRIYHSASRVQAPEVDEQDDDAEGFVGASTGASSTARGPSSSRTQTVRPAQSYCRSSEGSGDETLERRSCEQSPSAFGEESLTTLEPEPMDPRSSTYRTQVYRQEYGRAYRAGYHRNMSQSSGISSGFDSKAGYDTGSNTPPGWSTSRSSTAPTSTYLSNPADTTTKGAAPGMYPSSPPEKDRSTFSTRGGGAQQSSRQNDASPLRPSNVANSQAMTLGASHHFMDLVNSNHTLSPFTRTLDTKGFAVRSHPVTPSTGSGGETSSSVGGFATRPSSLSTTPSHFVREGRSYFEKQQVVSETGAGKRRVFKMAGNKSGSASTPASPGKRPGSSPLQANAAYDDTLRRANSASSVIQVRGPLRNTGSSRNGQSESGRVSDLRRRAMGHNERSLTMGAIRE